VPVLLNSAGKPEPPTAVVARLRAIHAGLHLRFVDMTGEHWAVCLVWGPEDRRWQEVQESRVDPDRAYDIVGYLPLTCSLDEAPSYLERMLRQYPKDEVRNMADNVLAFNAAPVAAATEHAIAEVLDMADPSATTPKRRGRPKKTL
jgi:hypothetical protein